MKKILFLMVAAFAVAFAACEKDNEGNLYTISVTAGEGGTVAGDNGKHKAGEELKFVAVPDNGYTFSCWSDGLKNNPRTIVVDSDIMLVALFAKSNGNNNGGNNQNNGENNGENNGGNGNNGQNTDDSPYYFTSGYWDGTLPTRENQVSQNYSSQFFFYDENGKKYGNEDSYYKGSLDNSYDFSWEWDDDSHSVLILNYGGSWAEDKCCIDIKEFNSDHIYGYFYKTLTDYATNHKNNTGTKVELKHLDIKEIFKFGELTIAANADGTIEVGGHLETNTKLNEFALYNVDGSIAYDFLEQNEQVKEKNNTMNDKGWAAKEPFVLDVKSTSLPIAKYSLSIKT